MERIIKNKSFLFLVVFITLLNCNQSAQTEEKIEVKEPEVNYEQLTMDMSALLKKHLDAVTNRDLETLRTTMSPDGEMQLILPKTEIIEGVDGFMEYHKEWFADTTWIFNTKILNAKAGNKLGYAVTEILYEIPNNKPEPYFNRMTVSYDLKLKDGNWYIIKDHASSIKKSTD